MWSILGGTVLIMCGITIGCLSVSLRKGKGEIYPVILGAAVALLLLGVKLVFFSR